MSEERYTGHNSFFNPKMYDDKLKPVQLPQKLPYESDTPLKDDEGVYSELARNIFNVFITRRDIPSYVGNTPIRFIECDYTTFRPNTFIEREHNLFLTVDYAHLEEFLDPLEIDGEDDSNLLIKYYISTIMVRNLLNSFSGLKPVGKDEVEKTILSVGPDIEQRISPADFEDVRRWRIAGAIALKVNTNHDSNARQLVESHTENFRNRVWRERLATEKTKDILSFALTEGLDRFVSAPIDHGPLSNQEIGLTNRMTNAELAATSLRLGNLYT